jgi:hypothetical protein
MPEDDVELDIVPDDQPAFPLTVYLAGLIWTIFGGLILVNAAVNLLLILAMAAAWSADAMGEIWPAVVSMVIGAAFVYVGLQTVRGQAKDTLVSGIGSMIFAVLNGGFGAFLLAGPLAIAERARMVAAILGGVSLVGGIGLLAAGVLALVGRRGYKAWRLARKP